MNYYYDKVLHLFAKVPRQTQLFTEILISEESFFFFPDLVKIGLHPH